MKQVRTKLRRIDLNRECPHCKQRFLLRNMNLTVENQSLEKMSEAEWTNHINTEHRMSIINNFVDKDLLTSTLDGLMFICENGCPAERFSRVL